MAKILKIKFFILSLCLFSQVFSQEVKTIEIIKANTMEYKQLIAEDANRLLGDVVFRLEDAYMFCDSAYFFDNRNTLVAYSNVRIKQGDSILFVSQYLEYDGNTRLAKMRDSVILKHNHSYLLTDSLDYNRNDEIAYYFEGGRMFDTENNNRLSSRRGYYYIQDKDYYAVDTVVLTNPKYYIDSDTMRYNTESEIAYFYGRTNIVSDSNFIYTENGYYNTKLDVSAFSKKSWMRSGSNYLRGDSLYYDRNIRYGEGFNNVSLIDTVENVIALGDYGYYYEAPENALLTGNAQVIFANDGDSIYMHSDTVRIHVDSLDFKLLRAYRHVQIYKADIQGRCDSLTFYSMDSIAHMYYNPILWAEGNKQVTADHIRLYFENKEPKTFYLDNNAYAIEKVDSLYYNQAKSDNIVGHIKDNELYQVDMYNNSNTIYYVTDDETQDLIAQNNLNCTDMTLYLENQKLKQLWFYTTPKGALIPMDQLSNLQLENFRWLEKYRPKTKEEIFIWRDIE